MKITWIKVSPIIGTLMFCIISEAKDTDALRQSCQSMAVELFQKYSISMNDLDDDVLTMKRYSDDLKERLEEEFSSKKYLEIKSLDEGVKQLMGAETLSRQEKDIIQNSFVSTRELKKINFYKLSKNLDLSKRFVSEHVVLNLEISESNLIVNIESYKKTLSKASVMADEYILSEMKGTSPECLATGHRVEQNIDRWISRENNEMENEMQSYRNSMDPEIIISKLKHEDHIRMLASKTHSSKKIEKKAARGIARTKLNKN